MPVTHDAGIHIQEITTTKVCIHTFDMYNQTIFTLIVNLFLPTETKPGIMIQ